MYANFVFKKQQAVAKATATIVSAVCNFSEYRQREAVAKLAEERLAAEDEIAGRGEAARLECADLSESQKQERMRNKFPDYRQADGKAQARGIGGENSRALNAVTAAVTGVLGGQTSLQTAAQYFTSQLDKTKFPEAIAPITGEIDPSRLPEDTKQVIRNLSSAVAGIAGGIAGDSALNAQIAAVVGQNAVENNLLRNSRGEKKLSASERVLNEKLKRAGLLSSDDYQQQYDRCGTDSCKQPVLNSYKKANENADVIIRDLYLSGILTYQDIDILLTSYSTKMMNGVRESDQALGRWKGDIYDIDTRS